MKKLDYEKALHVFENYVLKCKTNITNDILYEQKNNGIKTKYIHSLEVVNNGTKVVKNLKFNPSFINFSKIAFLNHDIGRFSQIILTGNFNDYDLFLKLGLKHHGELGRKILENGIINHQIPETRIFDEPIKKIVNDHVTESYNNEQLKILGKVLFKNEDAYDIFNNFDEKLKIDIIIAITQIVQDVDRLDILRQILSDRWTPIKQELKIDPKVFEKFYQGENLDINYLKNNGLWNANVGELVRLGFINQIHLYSVAEMILEENIILKLKEKRNNPKLKDAFVYTNDILKEMLKNSEDGITVSRVKILSK